MRPLTVLLLLSLLAVSVSAVVVPFKSCGSSGDDATIYAISSNEFPPTPGDTLYLNITGNLTKQVTAGTYNISIVINGVFPLPVEYGDNSDFHALPWPVGQVNFTFSKVVSKAAGPGSYSVKIQAADQDGTEVFCLTVVFVIKGDQTVERAVWPPALNERQRPKQASLRPILRMLQPSNGGQ